MKSASSLLPNYISTPEGAVFAGLDKPEKPKAVSGHRKRRVSENKRRLTDKQRETLLGRAAARIQEEAKHRKGRWLRRFDENPNRRSGCRTKQQRWTALALLAEPIFARVDIATLCLGWLDDNGQFNLNRQAGLAEDSGLAPHRVSRTLKALEIAGYIRRKHRRLYKNGTHWVTRVTIHLRTRFFTDLGVGHELAEVRPNSKSSRTFKLAAAAKREQQRAMDELTQKALRRNSHRQAQAARRAAQARADSEAKEQAARQEAERLSRLAAESPQMAISQIKHLLKSGRNSRQ